MVYNLNVYNPKTAIEAVQSEVDNLDGDAMRGTDSAALASNYTSARAGYIDDIKEDLEHITAIFPEATNETVTFTAGGTNNTFGSWAEIVDNNAVTFSSKAAASSIHLTSIQIETTDTDDKVYLVEISYGSGNTIVTRSRFYSGTKFTNAIAQTRLHTAIIPAGETIYYRLACETASATATVSIRYHTHT